MAATRKRKKAATGAVARLEKELPKTLREYSRNVRKELTRIERDVEKVTAVTRKRGIKLFREASYELGSLEQQGEKAWQRLTTPYRRKAVSLLQQLEKAVAPPARRRKKAAKKKVAKKKVAKKTTRKKATKRKATKRAKSR
jgi:hypothetical protein